MIRDLDGRQLAAHRVRLGMTQVQLAERLGVSTSTVQNWESGRHEIKGIYAEAIDQLLSGGDGKTVLREKCLRVVVMSEDGEILDALGSETLDEIAEAWLSDGPFEELRIVPVRGRDHRLVKPQETRDPGITPGGKTEIPDRGPVKRTADFPETNGRIPPEPAQSQPEYSTHNSPPGIHPTETVSRPAPPRRVGSPRQPSLGQRSRSRPPKLNAETA